MKKNLVFLLLLVFNFFTSYAENEQNVKYSKGSESTRFVDTIKKFDYKGFLDLGYILGVGDLPMERLELLTSHGIQVNSYLFAGLGTGINYYSSEELLCAPIFVNFRGTCKGGKIEPFIDFKIGYSVIDIKGFYLNPSVGGRLKMGEKYALNANIGYVIQGSKYSDEYESGTETYGGISLRIGVEF